MPGSSRSSACRASSVPSSCVAPVRAAAGGRENMAFCAATLAAAVLSGAIAAMGKRVRRSTSVCRLRPAPMTPSASRSPKRLLSSCPHGRSQIDVRNGMRLRPARPPQALRLRRRPRGRHRTHRSRLASSAYVHRQTVSGRQRVTGPPGCSMARHPHISGDRPRRDRSATHAHRRPAACVLSNFCGPFRRFF